MGHGDPPFSTFTNGFASRCSRPQARRRRRRRHPHPAVRLHGTHPYRCRAAGAQEHGEEPSSALRRLEGGWTPDLCRVVGYRSCRRTYPSCWRWGYAPLWPGRVRQHVPWRSHVRADQDLAKWHVKVNLNQKRFAVVSAVAATALPSLVMARGHRIEGVAECPLVVSNELEAITKTKAAVEALKGIDAHADVAKVISSKKVRAGRGKSRGRKYAQRRGPLIVYGEDKGVCKAFRNIPGVETSNVRSLNLLQLAPGGHLGRFVIWTESAFGLLDEVFGTFEKASSLKKDYTLPSAKISNPDVTRIINSDEIQSVVRPAGSSVTQRPFTQKKNPLRNRAVLFRLNPYAKTAKRIEVTNEQKRKEGKLAQSGKKQPLLTANDKFLETLHS